jgi:hypothetical protein
MEHGADQVFVFPGESSKKDGDVAALAGGELTLHRPLEMIGAI